MEVTADKIFHDFITKSKSKDAALTAFYRAVRKKELPDSIVPEVRALFQPIQQERINKRGLKMVGAVAEKRVFKLADVLYNIRLAKRSLAALERADDVMLAILFMTGRRTGEVGGTTKFDKLRYHGTIKGGKEGGTARYLCSYERIKRGLLYLNKEGWRGLPVSKVNPKIAMPLMRRLETYKGVEVVHDLRRMHMAVWIKRLTQRKTVRAMSPHDRAEFIGRFVNESLGHTNPQTAMYYLNCEIK